MGSDQTNLLQGTLKTRALDEMRGLGISRRIEFQVKLGSLFAALHRMEEQGWLVPIGGAEK